MKFQYQALGLCVAGLAALASCQSLDPAWGKGHYGGKVGVWYPKSASKPTSKAPLPTSIAEVAEAPSTKPSTTSIQDDDEETSTTTTTQFVTRYTTITLPVTVPRPTS